MFEWSLMQELAYLEEGTLSSFKIGVLTNKWYTTYGLITLAQTVQPLSLPLYDIHKRQRIPKGQSKMDHPEKLATQGTQDEEKQKIQDNMCWTPLYVN